MREMMDMCAHARVRGEKETGIARPRGPTVAVHGAGRPHLERRARDWVRADSSCVCVRMCLVCTGVCLVRCPMCVCVSCNY